MTYTFHDRAVYVIGIGAYRYIGIEAIIDTLSIGLQPTIEILSTALSHAGRVSIQETHNIGRD